eukprot:COSAG01_NODE_1645_length_9639_cov_14.725786_3_plen_83_part_00
MRRGRRVAERLPDLRARVMMGAPSRVPPLSSIVGRLYNHGGHSVKRAAEIDNRLLARLCRLLPRPRHDHERNEQNEHHQDHQ